MKARFRMLPMLAGALLLLPALARAADGPPVFLVQPANAVAREGEQVTFSAQVDGTVPLSSQWSRNGVPLTNATSPSLLTPPLTLGDDGAIFSLHVSNVFGVATSSNALLTVRPGIIVSAAANGSVETVLYRGWPLVLEVSLTHPDAFQSNAVPLLISATTGPWFHALGLDIRNAQGQFQTWPLHSVELTNETVQLDGHSGARMLWSLSPAETAVLPLGDFEVSAILNTTNVTPPGAWKGVLRSPPVTLSISDPPALLSHAQAEQKARLLADYALLQGDSLSAQAEINSLLAAYPTNIGGLTYSAYLQQETGSFDGAYQHLQAALEEIGLQSPNASEPPAELLALQAELYPIVAPPVLESTLQGAQLRISWSGYPFFHYRLEGSSDLSAWSSITTNFTIISNRFSIAASITASNRFFRFVR